MTPTDSASMSKSDEPPFRGGQDPKSLPIHALDEDIRRCLTSGNRLVVVAATGSGKTTQIPQMLWDAGLSGGQDILVLQPRRVAARSVATRVAWERRSSVGREVGYQVRFEDRTSDATRICFLTEGILLRRLQSDPDLKGVGIVIFDEFHERNLMSDVALAWVRHMQRSRRPDLKIVVMSATLDAGPIARYLTAKPESEAGSVDSTGDETSGVGSEDVPVLVSEGRWHPVEVRWADYTDDRPAIDRAVDAVEKIIHQGWEGDVLVFMPGMGEILETMQALRAARYSEPVVLLPLHGELSPQDQDRVFEPCPRRKIVVATNVAETSITIDGIRHVVDSGLARVARYDPERGIPTLHVEEISRASAEQRMGRAGRTAPGTCWRLWTESGHLNRAERNTPEIQRADLAEVVLLLHSLGVRDAAEFEWLDRPDKVAVRKAEDLLKTLGALKADGVITDVGREMLRFPVHPRFSRMMVEARRRECIEAAALCAALVSGRDILLRVGREDRHLQEARELFEGNESSDFFTLMAALAYARRESFRMDACRRMGIHAHAARQVEDTYRHLMQLTGSRRDAGKDGKGSDDGAVRGAEGGGGGPRRPDEGALERCILAGFVDQLAVRLDQGSLECTLSDGRRATLARESVVRKASFLVAAQVREISGRDGKLTLLNQCTGIEAEWLEELFPQHLTERLEHLYDRTHRRVAAVRVRRFRDILLGHSHEKSVDPDAAGECLADAAVKGWIELPNLDHGVRQFMGRVDCLRQWQPDLEFPVWNEVTRRAVFARAFRGLTLAKEAREVRLLPVFERFLGEAQREWLKEMAPLTLPWVGDRPLKLVYQPEDLEAREPAAIEAHVKITDCFKMKEHPAIAEGGIPVKLWLQLPDGKRLCSTSDWPKWRAREYPGQRSQLRSSYPEFLWP